MRLSRMLEEMALFIPLTAGGMALSFFAATHVEEGVKSPS